MSRPSTLTDKEREAVTAIYNGFKNLYGFPQGKCMQVAQAIQDAIGGETVIGYIQINHVTDRPHWWVNRNGTIIDPMADELSKTDTIKHMTVEEMNDSLDCFLKTSGMQFSGYHRKGVNE